MPSNPAFQRESAAKTLTELHDRMRRLERVRNTRSLNAIFDGHGTPITTGVKGDVRIDFLSRLVGWKLVADQVGAVVVDIWKESFENFPPTIADSICGTKPSLAAQLKNSENEDLTGWTTVFEAGDYLRFNIDSVDGTLTRVVLTLELAS